MIRRFAAFLAIGITAALPATAGADIAAWRVLAIPPPTGPVFPIRALVADPQTPTTLYAAISNAAIETIPPLVPGGHGVYKSLDGGLTWSASNTGLTTPLVTALAIDPATPATLYAGTDGGGVFKTTDGGDHWTESNVGLDALEVYALAIDPTAPATVYAGTQEGGVFKSTDGGAHWTAPGNGLPTVYALAVDPGNPAIVYAGVRVSGVVKSVDGGATWSITGPLVFHDDLAGVDYTGHFVAALAIDPTNGGVYAGAQDQAGLFKSTDGGQHWSAISRGIEGIAGVRYVAALALDPASPSTLYVGVQQGGVFRSLDGGGRWDPINFGLLAREAYAFAIVPGSPSTVYVGDYYGHVDRLETLATNVDRMKCYKARTRTFVPRDVTLSDRIQQGPARLKKVEEVCAPTTMVGQPASEGPVNPDARLTCYRLSRAAAATLPPPRSSFNELEPDGLALVKARSLCVPSHASGAPAPAGADRFACYKLRPYELGGFETQLDDALGTLRARFFELDMLCVPVSQDGSAIVDAADDLLCLRLKQSSSRQRLPWPRPFPVQTLDVEDDFGVQSARVTSPVHFCTPARKPH